MALKHFGGKVFQGTVKDFVEGNLKLNGQFVDGVTLSMLGKYQVIQTVGEHKQKGARGRPAAVYQIDTAGSMFSF